MSNNLTRTEVAGNQSDGIFPTINDSDAALDAAITGALTVEFNAASEQVTDAQFKANSVFFLTQGSPPPSGSATLEIVPDSPPVPRGMFVVKNDTGVTVTVEYTGASPSGPTVNDGTSVLFFADGSTIYKVG